MEWNSLAIENIFLTTNYLAVLEKSAPINMTCYFLGIFKNEKIVGIALSQFLDLNKLESFGERDKCIKTSVRNFAFKNFSSHVLFIGNNMLTGQNAFAFSKDIDEIQGLRILKSASIRLKANLKSIGKKVHITTFKDFNAEDIKKFEIPEFKSHYQFSTQPNMVFTINENWKTNQDYINALSKKYRDQYKRARKKLMEL